MQKQQTVAASEGLIDLSSQLPSPSAIRGHLLLIQRVRLTAFTPSALMEEDSTQDDRKHT